MVDIHEYVINVSMDSGMQVFTVKVPGQDGGNIDANISNKTYRARVARTPSNCSPGIVSTCPDTSAT